MLRQEVYALDGTDKAAASLHRHRAELHHPACCSRRAATATPCSSPMPREAHQLPLRAQPGRPAHQPRADAGGGRVRQRPASPPPSATAAASRTRRLSPADQAKQTQILITYTENRVTNAVDAADDYRTPLPCESRTYELTGLTLPAGQSRFTFDDVLDAGTTAQRRSPTSRTRPPGVLQKRLIEHVRTLYRRNDLTGAVAARRAAVAGACPSRATSSPSRRAWSPRSTAAASPTRCSRPKAATSTAKATPTGGSPPGGSSTRPTSADTPAQELAYARQHFFLPHRYRDPFHTDAVSTESFVTYDAYDLLVLETRDALGNRVTVGERDAAGNLTTSGQRLSRAAAAAGDGPQPQPHAPWPSTRSAWWSARR